MFWGVQTYEEKMINNDAYQTWLRFVRKNIHDPELIARQIVEAQAKALEMQRDIDRRPLAEGTKE